MIEYIDDPTDPRLGEYTQLRDVSLRKHLESEHGLYIAESEKVIRRALRAGHRPRSLLLTEAWLPDFADVHEQYPELPVRVVSEETLEQATGFHVHRGALASMHRPEPRSSQDILQTSQLVVILDGVSDHTNVGAVFRSVAALGADAVLLTRESADPLYRRSVRVSMGAVLHIPWARLPRWQESGPMLREYGFETVSLALDETAVTLRSFVQSSRRGQKLAVVFGAEGHGVSRQALAASDHRVIIPMEHNIDSLNIATSAAITLWAIRDGMQSMPTELR